MFTGLITDNGEIRSISPSGDNWNVRIGTGFDTSTFDLGESIACDGACLTVTTFDADSFTVDASPETLRRTTLGVRKAGDRIHLERALAVGDRLGGHYVLGHVDGVGTVVKTSREKNAWILEFEVPESVSQFLIEKGSVAIDGVSLTVNSVRANRFDVAIIPFTAGKTNVAGYEVGRKVNLEGDVLGKYVKKLLGPTLGADGGSVTMDMLTDNGFGKGTS
jgi:riboflavin synthase